MRRPVIPILSLTILLCPAVTAQKSSLLTTKSKPAHSVASNVRSEKAKTAQIIGRGNSEVTGATFRLGEIAEITGGDKALVAKLKQIEIGAAPLPGMSRPLSPGDIKIKLRAAHLDIPTIKLIAPENIRITRASGNVSNDEITQAAISAARATFKELEGASLELSIPFGKVSIPIGKPMLLAGGIKGQPDSASISVPITILVNGKTVQTVEVSLRIRRKVRVLIATHILEPNTLLSRSDLAFASIELPPGFSDPVKKRTLAVGKKLKQRVLEGMPISNSMLTTPPDIKTGDHVTIEVNLGPVHITSEGVALQTAVIGDMIRVQTSDTKKELVGELTAQRVVRVRSLEPEPDDAAVDDTKDADSKPADKSDEE